MNYAIRALAIEDEPALWAMLMHAAYEEDLAVVRANPDLARYVCGWGLRRSPVAKLSTAREAVRLRWCEGFTE